MAHRVPAQVGMRLADVDTPALLVDLDAFERNLDRMAAAAKRYGVRLRPHAKTHKCPTVAHAQLARGAVGQCCQKVGEAEVLVEAGVKDVLVTNQVVGRPKIARLAGLARRARLGVCADDAGNVKQLSEAATAFGATLDVYVEIDCGAARCGVPAGAPALALAETIQRSPGLRFAGLQSYQGRAQHIRDHGERRHAIALAGELTRQTIDQLRRHGIECGQITGAGTGTYAFEATSGVWTELQAGSYAFMDADYRKNLGEDGKPIAEFEQSLFLWATVMSRSGRERAVVDAGLKALSIDSGMPDVHELAGVAFVGASDEHGKLDTRAANVDLHIGDKIRLVPGHCDPTINLHDWYVGVRGDRVEAVWPIAARGALL